MFDFGLFFIYIDRNLSTDGRALQFIPAPTSPWLVACRGKLFTRQQKNVTCHNSYDSTLEFRR